MAVLESLSVAGHVEPPEAGAEQGTGRTESLCRHVGPAQVEFSQLGAASQYAGHHEQDYSAVWRVSLTW